MYFIITYIKTADKSITLLFFVVVNSPWVRYVIFYVSTLPYIEFKNKKPKSKYL